MSKPYSIANEKDGFIPVTCSYTGAYIASQAQFFMPAEFKDRLRRTREARGLSQLDLANKTGEGGKAGLQPAAISHFETGQRSPSFENLRRLADALSVSIDYLLGRIDEEQHGQGIAAAPRAQQLFRNAENLSEDSFSQLEMMARMLKERDEKRKGSSQ